MQYSELKERIYYRIGRGDDQSSLDNDILYACEMAQDDITSTINLYELQTHDKTSLAMAADTQDYSLPTDFGKMIQIWNNDQYGQELLRIHPSNYKNYLGDIDTETATDPRYYDILDASGTAKRITLFPFRSSVDTGSITAFSDYSGTVAGTVLATDADHGLQTGNTITIVSTGGTFDGTYAITYVSSSTFYFTLTWPGATDTATWTRQHYIPFVYQKRLAYLTGATSENVLTEFYPQLYIEAASYYLYRDAIYRDTPEKIAFRRGEYQKQIDLTVKAQRQPNEIRQVSPKRIIPSNRQQFTVQSQGYTS